MMSREGLFSDASRHCRLNSSILSRSAHICEGGSSYVYSEMLTDRKDISGNPEWI